MELRECIIHFGHTEIISLLSREKKNELKALLSKKGVVIKDGVR